MVRRFSGNIVSFFLLLRFSPLSPLLLFCCFFSSSSVFHILSIYSGTIQFCILLFSFLHPTPQDTQHHHTTPPTSFRSFMFETKTRKEKREKKKQQNKNKNNSHSKPYISFHHSSFIIHHHHQHPFLFILFYERIPCMGWISVRLGYGSPRKGS